MRPTASNRGLFRKPNCATSLPRDDQAGYAGLDRGDGRLAEGGRHSRPVSGGLRAPMMPQAGGTPMVSGGGDGGGPLSIDFGILGFSWRSFVLAIGFCSSSRCRGLVLVLPMDRFLPAGSAAAKPRVHRPADDLMWFFGRALLLSPSRRATCHFSALTFLVQFVLYWLLPQVVHREPQSRTASRSVRFSGRSGFSSDGHSCGLSVITIVGWAWVYVALDAMDMP